jgi:hypothetical protein
VRLITVLAAEALSGFLSLRVSVTLAALLTVILLPWALLSFRGSASFAWLTLAMLAMLWRGEAWKTVFLQSEQQVLELQQQQRPPIESNSISFGQGQRILYDDARRVAPRACPQSLVEEYGGDHPQSERYNCAEEEPTALRTKRHNVPVIAAESGLAVSLAPSPEMHTAQFHELHRHSPPDISGDLTPNCENQSDLNLPLLCDI